MISFSLYSVSVPFWGVFDLGASLMVISDMGMEI